MDKTIDDEARRKFPAYVSAIESGDRIAPLTEEVIKRHVARCLRRPLYPDNPKAESIIHDVEDEGIRIVSPNGRRFLCNYWQIIGADKVILHCIGKKGVAPKRYDLREGAAAIGVKSIPYDSFAPTLAELVRREMSAAGGTPKRGPAKSASPTKGMLRAEDAAPDRSSDDDTFLPQDGDSRTLTQRLIRERRGQEKFRNALRERYGGRCLVTDCQILDVLEAAHIKPYRGEPDNHKQNGLLLRADIHTLFDLDLIGINPKSLQVEMHPDLKRDPQYAMLCGKRLGCTSGRDPSRDALKLRYRQFKKRCRTLK